MQRARGGGTVCPSARADCPSKPENILDYDSCLLSLECTVHDGSSLISKWLHKRSPPDEQIVVTDFAMSFLKIPQTLVSYLLNWMGRTSRKKGMTSHPCGVLQPSKVREEMGSEPNDVSDVICVSQDWSPIPCGVGALRTPLHHAKSVPERHPNSNGLSHFWEWKRTAMHAESSNTSTGLQLRGRTNERVAAAATAMLSLWLCWEDTQLSWGSTGCAIPCPWQGTSWASGKYHGSLVYPQAVSSSPLINPSN